MAKKSIHSKNTKYPVDELGTFQDEAGCYTGPTPLSSNAAKKDDNDLKDKKKRMEKKLALLLRRQSHLKHSGY